MSEPTDPLIRTVSLDTPIQRGETSIATLQLRKPRSGELRGLSLVDLGQLKVDALTKVLPRITVPPLTEAEVGNMEVADLLACGAEIGSFLLQKSQRMDVLGQ
ncbi:phage tail assembly protein [Sphingobium limneticum]|uniref:Phage tail assembly protein n=1 Tax=Sphingobium limneticum TaxID=1007511 RepID=A0A5J5IA13_9SPHN|nr:phage tail assembly protein [Sphingobium limneticum]KAA9020748.1 phage tail assembly protein [Sphingobium limneticum]KAA9033074.1 phage tail assembly protein [Sphingobium limneticum]